ncbi:unnamed protein product [Debaryomyces tyrocola]|nr:unnamed protein product [Debaryomyces tyrocola]
MAKLVRHLTSNEEIVSSNLAEGNFFWFLGLDSIKLAFVKLKRLHIYTYRYTLLT